MPKIYNKLDNPELQFALLWRVRREWCDWVKGGKHYKYDALTEVAGNGRFGFPTRRQKRELANMTTTVDKTGLKKKRGSVVRPRKETCKLATNFQVYWNTLDPEEQARRVNEVRRAKRAKNRNRRANYGRRKAVILTTNPTRGRRGGLERTCRQT